MKLIFVCPVVIIGVVSVDSASVDPPLRKLRRQLDNTQQTIRDTYPAISYEEEKSNGIYLDFWNRWLLQDNSMKTTTPVALASSQPTKAPTRQPLSPATAAPIVSPTTLPVTQLPPLSPTPVLPPPVSVVPISAMPSTAPSLAPNDEISVAPSSMPTTLPVVPQTVAPATNRPTTQAPVGIPPTAPRRTLLQILETLPELSTLRAAIATVDSNRNISPFLTQVLNNPNTSLTLFTPVNSGFSALGEIIPGYLAQLLTPNFGLHLFDLLAYHGTSGIISTANFPISNLPMLAAGRVNVTSSSNSTFVVRTLSPQAAQILLPLNIPATNGLVHIVNNVLLPQFVFQNLLEGVASSNSRNGGQFSTLLRLVTIAGLEATFAEATGVTMLAPINAAIPIETERFLVRPGNEDILTAVLTYHIVTELFNYAVQAVPTQVLLESLQGENILAGLVRLSDNGLLTQYNRANQLGYLVVRENILYAIDSILIPASLEMVVPQRPTSNTTTVFAFDSSLEMTPNGERK
jgi:uncharacterized surface protein with fasciclin (FAS1) repeats